MTIVLRSLLSLLVVVPLALTAACNVKVDKSADGRDKNVKVDTPLGGIHVNTDAASAQNTGIAVYPGAKVEPDHDGDKAADIHMGFGPWQMRIKVVNYATPDSQDKVISFYRTALGGAGNVIECRGNQPVGSPARTSEGLTCSDDDKNEHVHSDKNDLMLKSGSKRRQRLLAIEHADTQSASGPTKFTVIALDLPAGSDEGRQSD